MNKPTVPEVLPLVRQIYARHAAGCCLHVVLDDGNINDTFVESAYLRAKDAEFDNGGAGHGTCVEVAAKMLRMTKTQRRKLVAARKMP